MSSSMNRGALCLLAVTLTHAQWTINRLDTTKYPNALCLDGSPGAFYVAPGLGVNSTKFIVHLQGGGWCTSMDDCALRAVGGDAYPQQPSLGSTVKWSTSGCPSLPNNTLCPVCVADGSGGGAISTDPSINPDFYDWTKVFVGYCDGSSFASDAAPVKYNATLTLHFGGRSILDAVFDTMLSSFGMNTAELVYIKGCSAGGMAVFLHIDRLRDVIHEKNPNALVLGNPGAGAILYTKSYAGDVSMSQLHWLWNYTRMYRSANSACLEAYRIDSLACFFPEFSLPFVSTPLFVANSLADLAQFGYLLGCDPRKSCNASQLNYVNHFRTLMLGAMAPVLRDGSPHGGWFVTCYVHVIENDNQYFANVTVGPKAQGQTMRATMSAWMSQQMQQRNQRATGYPVIGALSIDGPWGSNPTCV